MIKGLEALEDIKESVDLFDRNYQWDKEFAQQFDEDLDIIEKELEALEIVKEKEVNVQNFKNTCSTMSYEQYLFMWKDGCFMGIMLTSKTMLTQEEYDLLRKVLLCD